MRKLITGLFVAGVSLGAAEAQATQESWKCIGPEYVCGKSGEKLSLGANAREKQVNKAYRTYTKKPRATSSSQKAAPVRGIMTGQASYYWQRQRVASGGWFNPNAMTAAHKTLPFGTRVRVTNNRNGRSVIVKINDRGPYVKGRIIDLSKAAAGAIGMQGAGVAPVTIEVLGKS